MLSGNSDEMWFAFYILEVSGIAGWENGSFCYVNCIFYSRQITDGTGANVLSISGVLYTPKHLVVYSFMKNGVPCPEENGVRHYEQRHFWNTKSLSEQHYAWLSKKVYLDNILATDFQRYSQFGYLFNIKKLSNFRTRLFIATINWDFRSVHLNKISKLSWSLYARGPPGVTPGYCLLRKTCVHARQMIYIWVNRPPSTFSDDNYC